MRRHRVAVAVSLVTAPQVYGGLISSAIWFESRVGGGEALLMLILSHTVLPLAPIVVDSARGRVDVFVSKREDRWKYYLASILAYSLGILYALWRGYWLYAVLTLSYAVSAALLAAVTVFAKWKISVHTAGVAGPTTALAMVVGWQATPLFLLLIPVAWARLELNAHTPAQLIAGALVAAGTTFLVYSLAL